MTLSLDQLTQVMPNLNQEKANQYLPFLVSAMVEAEINTPLRKAAFLAQLSHESGELRYFEEIASGAAYEGRKNLGNTQPGDGKKFKGRSPIQLTGRANYRQCGNALGIDLENHPEKAIELENTFRIACWFWTSRKLNIFADKDKDHFDEITFRVNGGYNGKKDRDKYYKRALEVLEVK